MNEIYGTDLRVWIEGVKVADAISHTLSIQMATRPTSNKDSGKFDTEAAGRFKISATSDALMVYGNFEAILSAMLNQTPVTVDFGQKEADPSNDLDVTKFYASGEFLITGFDSNAADAANATYTATFSHSSGFTMNLDDMVLLVMSNQVDVAVHGQSTGAAGVFVKGGIAPYTYAWTGGATTAIISGKAAGTYTCTVTDSSSNTGSVTVVITEP